MHKPWVRYGSKAAIGPPGKADILHAVEKRTPPRSVTGGLRTVGSPLAHGRKARTHTVSAADLPNVPIGERNTHKLGARRPPPLCSGL